MDNFNVKRLIEKVNVSRLLCTKSLAENESDFSKNCKDCVSMWRSG